MSSGGPPSAEAVAYGKAAEAFYDASSTTALARLQGHAFHQPVVIHDTTENYMVEVEIRLQLIKRVQKRLYKISPDLHLNLMHFAVLQVIDLRQLRSWSKGDGQTTMAACLRDVEPFIKACMGKGTQKKKTEDKPASKRGLDASQESRSKRRKGADATPVPLEDDSSTSRDDASVLRDERARTAPDDAVERNVDAREAAFKRDREQCVFTGGRHPHVAHIIPHAINKSLARFYRHATPFEEFLSEFRASFGNAATDLVFQYQPDGTPVLGCSDKPWDLMCQAPHIHNYFDRAAVGLKPIKRLQAKTQDEDSEEGKTLICVEWRFLPEKLSRALLAGSHLRNNPTSKRPIATCLINLESPGLAGCLTRELNSTCGDAVELGNCHNCVHDKSGMRIVSGRRFEIPAYIDDAPKTMCALEVSWLALRLASISGAAEAVDLLNDEPSADWDKAVLKQLGKDWRRNLREWRDEDDEEVAALEDSDSSDTDFSEGQGLYGDNDATSL